MSSHLSRAQLLYQQARYELAEQEIRQALIEQPHNADAHAILGLCLMRQDKLPEAQAETEQAIVAAPDDPFPHYSRAVVLLHRNRYREAEESAGEAVRLEPDNPDYHAQLANALFQQQQWQAALDATLVGLQYDAEHSACSNLRSMALTKLGRQEDSIAAIDESLARQPDDELAHANKGWTLLHQAKPQAALEHFREALRLDPNLEYAQAGIVQALQARNPIYRWMLGYFLWMARLTDRAKWGVILGGYIGYRVLRGVAKTNPDLAPWIAPLLWGYLLFVLLTWFAAPMFNLLLRFNKFGRHALSRDQRISSNWFGLCLLAVVVGAAVGFLTPLDDAKFLILYGAGMALPLVTLYQCDEGWPRQTMKLAVIAMAVVGAAALVSVVAGLGIEGPLAVVFLLGAIASPWLANYLASVTVQK